MNRGATRKLIQTGKLKLKVSMHDSIEQVSPISPFCTNPVIVVTLYQVVRLIHVLVLGERQGGKYRAIK